MSEIWMEGRIPALSEIETLKQTPFERKPVSEGEVNSAIKNIIAGLLLTPFLVFLGLRVIVSFKGIGMLIFGFGPLLAAPFVGIILIFNMGLIVILRDPRSKNVLRAFQWIWQVSFLKTFVSEKEKELDYAYGSAVRSVPDVISKSISKELVSNYLKDTGRKFRSILDESSKGMDVSFNWEKNTVKESVWSVRWELPEESIKIISEKEVEPGVCEAIGNFQFLKVLEYTYGSNTFQLYVAGLLVHINNCYIKNGKFWFTNDLMPKIQVDMIDVSP